jgi:hypothetical protein
LRNETQQIGLIIIKFNALPHGKTFLDVLDFDSDFDFDWLCDRLFHRAA